MPTPRPRQLLLEAFELNSFDGWELSGVTLYALGTPFTVINSAGNTGFR